MCSLAQFVDYSIFLYIIRNGAYFKMAPGQHGARNPGHVGQPAIELEEDVYARREGERSEAGGPGGQAPLSGVAPTRATSGRTNEAVKLSGWVKKKKA